MTSIVIRSLERERGADLDLDLLGGALADEEVVRLARVRDDRLVELVAGDPHRLAVDDAGEGDDRDVGRAAADVDDHVARRFGDRHPRADRRRHRFLDQVHFAGLGAHRAVFDGAPLDLGDLRRHADDDPRPQPAAALVRLADEVGQHLLGGFEVGDDAVLHRLDRGDVAGRPAQHLLGFGADGLDPPVDRVERDNRRLADDDALAAREDAGVGRAEIDGQIVGETREQATKTRDPEATLMPIVIGARFSAESGNRVIVTMTRLHW